MKKNSEPGKRGMKMKSEFVGLRKKTTRRRSDSQVLNYHVYGYMYPGPVLK